MCGGCKLSTKLSNNRQNYTNDKELCEERMVEKNTIKGDEGFYKGKIIELIEKISNQEFLEIIYGFVKRLYKEEKAED